MAEAVVGVRLKLVGKDETKAALQDLHAEMLNTTSAKLDDAKATRDLARDARTLNNDWRMQSQILQAQYPVLNNLNRIASATGTVFRAAATTVNLWTLANIALEQTTSQVQDLMGQVAKDQRDYSLAVKQYGQDSIQTADALEQLNTDQAKLDETLKQDQANRINAIVGFGTSLGLMVSTGIEVALKFPEIIKGFQAFGMMLRTEGLAMLTNPYTLAIIGIGAALALLILYWPQVTEAFRGFTDFMRSTFSPVIQWIEDNWRILVIALTGGAGALAVLLIDHWKDIANGLATIWKAIQVGAITFWNGLVTFANITGNAIITGVEAMANGFVAAINGIIDAVNALAKALHLPTLGHIGNVTLPHFNIPMIAAANGFEGVISQPTMMLVGEKGPEAVSVNPSGKHGSGSVNVYINVQGSIQSESDFFKKADNHFKAMLKKNGFKA